MVISCHLPFVNHDDQSKTIDNIYNEGVIESILHIFPHESKINQKTVINSPLMDYNFAFTTTL
jgi:hypothetical protein